MTFIDSLQGFWGTDSSDQIESTQVSDSPVSEVVNTFSGLMSLLQDSGTEDEQSSADFELSVDSIQQSLLSAIGLEGIVGEDGVALGSLSSITDMQSSLLSSLQASLFSSAAQSADISNITEGAEELDSVSTFLGSIDSASTFLTGEDGLGAHDLFDTINVLNHIPIVDDIYTEVMEQDAVSPISELVGGYAFGGPLGLAYAATEVAVESFTGKSIYENLSDYFFSEEEQESIDSTVSQVGDTITEVNKAYHFVKGTYTSI